MFPDDARVVEMSFQNQSIPGPTIADNALRLGDEPCNNHLEVLEALLHSDLSSEEIELLTQLIRQPRIQYLVRDEQTMAVPNRSPVLEISDPTIQTNTIRPHLESGFATIPEERLNSSPVQYPSPLEEHSEPSAVDGTAWMEFSEY